MNKARNTPVTLATPASAWLRPLNARSIALSILLGSHPPELPSRAFVGLADLFGIPSGTMRTALSRLVRSGEIVADDGRYRLAARLLARQRAQDAGRQVAGSTWDGRWHTIVAADDQRDQAVRREFRAVMANHRFGELRPDIWLRPSNLSLPPVAPDWIATTGATHGIASGALTARLWDLSTIAHDAERMHADLATTRTAVDWSDPASIPVLFTLSAAVVRFLRNEPLLPRELTPPGWPVDRLRVDYDRFERDHQRLLQAFLRRT